AVLRTVTGANASRAAALHPVPKTCRPCSAHRSPAGSSRPVRSGASDDVQSEFDGNRGHEAGVSPVRAIVHQPWSTRRTHLKYRHPTRESRLYLGDYRCSALERSDRCSFVTPSASEGLAYVCRSGTKRSSGALMGSDLEPGTRTSSGASALRVPRVRHFEAEHHPALVMLGDVAIGHPDARIERRWLRCS